MSGLGGIASVSRLVRPLVFVNLARSFLEEKETATVLLICAQVVQSRSGFTFSVGDIRSSLLWFACSS
jgi:hypothetical protein